MLLSLVDAFRCPAAHEESPLVLSIDQRAGERVQTGLLGCPICHARYPILGGAVDFTGDGTGVRHAVSHERADSVRLAAQLGLSDPGGIVLLTGRYASVHSALIGLADVTCVLMDSTVVTGPAAVSIHVRERLPFGAGVLRGAAVNALRSSPVFLSSTVRCVRRGGRIVATSGPPPPRGIRLLAADSLEWVGEVAEAGPMFALRRASRPD